MANQTLKEEAQDINIEDVLDYLKANPDAAHKHPDLLEHLLLSDDRNPGIASLIEKQATVLRDKLHQTHAQTNELIASARENEFIQERVFDLALEVLSEPSLDAMVSTLCAYLQERFSVDFVSLRVPLADEDNDALTEFSQRYAKDEHFTMALERIGKSAARCDQRFPQPLLEFFFEDAADLIGSAALVPLHLTIQGTEHTGIMALGAKSTDRFDARLGTHHLERIGKCVVAGISRFLNNR